MKVCFLVGTLGRGGAERQLLYMLQALQNQNIQSRILCLTAGEALETDIKSLGIEVEWVGSSPSRIFRLAKIIASLKKQPADVLQSTHFYTNIYVALAGRASNVKNIGAIRCDITSEISGSRIYGKHSLSAPLHLIANSKQARRLAIDKGIATEKIDFVKNVVKAEIKDASRRSAENKTINIIFVGRLAQQKRPEVFVRLAARLRRDLPETELKFQIIGDGPLRPLLEKLVLDLGMSEREISFLGEQSEMSVIYRQADILVLTSEFEGTPNVILEAMAYGIPAVATKVGGVPEILTEECGILTDPSNFEELVEGATRLILNRNLRVELGKQGKKRVAENHSIDYLEERLTGIYRKLLKNSPYAVSDSVAKGDKR